MLTVQQILETIEQIAETVTWVVQPNPDPLVTNYEGVGDGWLLLVTEVKNDYPHPSFYGGAISSPQRALLIRIPGDTARKLFNIVQTKVVN
jgi:hypothetical protein